MGPIAKALLANPASAHLVGESTLADGLMRETKEIEDAHKRRVERQTRIAGPQRRGNMCQVDTFRQQSLGARRGAAISFVLLQF